MEGFTRFNMNHYCKVYMTDKAKECYINHYSDINSKERIVKSLDEQIDSDGYLKLQLWVAFSIFGKYIRLGSDLLNSNEFYLETKWLEV